MNDRNRLALERTGAKNLNCKQNPQNSLIRDISFCGAEAESLNERHNFDVSIFGRQKMDNETHVQRSVYGNPSYLVHCILRNRNAI